MPPEGVLVGPPSKQWRVGKMLGSGACGSVHDIAPASSRREEVGGWVVKIAPVPPESGTASKRRKKKKTPLERNADLLHYENSLYRNVLNDLRGVQVPDVPHSGDGGPPGYGDAGGYRFLCMEKMAAPLSSIVPILLDDQRRRKTKVKSIPFGEVGSTLVGLVQQIHGQNLVFVDVKPENFMLAQPASKRAQTCSDACRRLRMIDFGLVENFRSRTAGGHRENLFPNGQFVGTPVYSSLNVLEGHTASRRDDLEALGYVMLELILMLFDEGRAESNTSPLPWSTGESDEEILETKRKAIDGDGSKEFFSQIGRNGNKGTEKAMKQFFKVVRKMDYTEKPNYEGLKDIIRDISIDLEDAEDEKTAATEQASQRSSLKRSSRRTRSRGALEDTHANTKPPAVAAKKRKSNRTRASEAVEVHQIDSAEDSDMEDFHSCCSGVEDMDWEAESDENTPPSGERSAEQIVEEDLRQSEAGPRKRAGKGTGRIEVVFISGPHKGESFALGGESPEVVTVGKGPPTPRSKKSGVYKIQNDCSAAASHVKLALHSAKGGVYSVRVTDLKASAGTEVNGKAVSSGKYKQAFVGGKVRIGESVMQLKRGG